jgi:hypothetical protein
MRELNRIISRRVKRYLPIYMPTNRIKIGLVVDPVYIYARFVEEVRISEPIRPRGGTSSGCWNLTAVNRREAGEAVSVESWSGAMTSIAIRLTKELPPRSIEFIGSGGVVSSVYALELSLQSDFTRDRRQPSVQDEYGQG